MQQTRVAAVIVFASGCASQQQTGKALQVTGAAAVLSGAVVASRGGCGQPDRYGSVQASMEECQPNGSRQAVGAVVAVAGMGVTALGAAIEADATRLDARKRSRSSSTQPQPVAQGSVPANSWLLALPEAPFSAPKPVPASAPAEEEGAGDPVTGDPVTGDPSAPVGTRPTQETEPTTPAEAEEAPVK